MAHRVTPGVELVGYRRDDVEVDPPYLFPDYVATRTRRPSGRCCCCRTRSLRSPALSTGTTGSASSTTT